MSDLSASSTIALHDLPHYAVFSQPKYEPDPEPRKTRPKSAHASTHPRNIQTSPLRSGGTPDVYLEKTFKPLFVNEPYEDASTRLQRRQQEQQKSIHKTPFLPSSPAKKSTSSGDIYGTIGKYPEHSAGGDRIRPRSAPPVQKKPFYPSNPGKKGGPGYYHLTILGHEYEYITEQQAKERNMKSASQNAPHAQSISPKPFLSRVRRQELFDDNAPFHDVELSPKEILKRDARSRTFLASGRNPNSGFYWQKLHESDLASSPSSSRRRGSTSSLSGSGASPYLHHKRPWSGMSVSRGTIAPFPEYMPEKDTRKKSTQKPVKPFRPSGTSSFTKPQPSILGFNPYK